jgi:hypothetical protein
MMYRPGDTADVPDEIADDWGRSGWVPEVPSHIYWRNPRLPGRFH